MKAYGVEIAVFVIGFVVMVLELVGSRMLAPYLGTSLYVWTSLIGIILGSLSVGYWWGGRMADQHASARDLQRMLLGAAFAISMVAFFNRLFLSFLQVLSVDLRLKAVLASAVLLGTPSMLLGMVVPYAVRLKLTTLVTSGSTAGNIYAISTIGSVLGTFVGGFFFIASLGTTTILFVLALVVLGVALMMSPGRLVAAAIAVAIGMLAWFSRAEAMSGGLKAAYADINTAYNRIVVYDELDGGTNRPIRTMQVSGERDSAVFLDGDGLVFDYLKFFRLVKHFRPDLQQALMIGGGAYAYPRDFLRAFPHATLQVVELDPKITELAKRYFHLMDNSRLHIDHQDGRTFLNTTAARYDAIFVDAFRSFYSLPFQLTTQEAVRRMCDGLTEDGVVFVNIISAMDGPQGLFLRAEYRTFTTVFPHVYLFPVFGNDGHMVQNIILVALKSSHAPTLTSADPELNGYLAHRWQEDVPTDVPILTDDYAPVDQYLALLWPRAPRMLPVRRGQGS